MVGGGMKKLKAMPRFAKEITITVISFVVLCVLWSFFIERYIVLSDQGLSMIGIALSTSIGVLTAIVVSFVLVVWQTSRRDRSESFLRWRNTLHQLFNYYDANLEKLLEINKEMMELTSEASAIASIKPMSAKRYRELTSKVLNKITEHQKQLLKDVRSPSHEQVEKGRLYKDIGDYLVMLTHAHLDHNIAHNLYKGLLDLRGLLYRLLSILIACIVVVTIAATTTPAGISDLFNAPLALILIAWAIYVLIRLGIEIKRFTRLEDEFRRQEQQA
jgi:hypothetical protein